jgi:hypothetical protein
MITWREPYAALLVIADSPTYDILVVRWAGFEQEAGRFRRVAWKFRRNPRGRKWHGHPELRSDIRDPGLKLAMQELVSRVMRNPVFRELRAQEMKFALIELMSVGWDSKPP